MDIDDNIEILNQLIDNLKKEYEKYFLRLSKIEPIILKDEVEQLIRLCHKQNQIKNSALQFRLNTLAAKYYSYKRYWSRVLRDIEEGRYKPSSPSVDSSQLQYLDPHKGTDDKKHPFYDEEKLKTIYKEYINARKRCKESIKGITFERLKQTILQHVKKLEEHYGYKTIDCSVTIKEGRAKIILKPLKQK